MFPVDTSFGGVCRHRSISPSSLLDTAISEEARPGPGLDEEQEVQEPLPSSTGRRHTLAEVSTCFSPGAPPCKCPWGPHTHLTGGLRGGAASSDDSAPGLPFLSTRGLMDHTYTQQGALEHQGWRGFSRPWAGRTAPWPRPLCVPGASSTVGCGAPGAGCQGSLDSGSLCLSRTSCPQS